MTSPGRSASGIGYSSLPSSSSSSSISSSISQLPGTSLSSRRISLSRRTATLFAVFSILALTLSLGHSYPATDGLDSLSYSDLLSSYWSDAISKNSQTRDEICPECLAANCSIPGLYASSSSSSLSRGRPSLAQVRSRRATPSLVKRYLLHELSMYLWLHPTFTPPKALAPLWHTYMTCPDELIAYSFESLKYDRPTAYMYTRTSASGGRLGKEDKVVKYFKRHAKTIRQYQADVQLSGYLDGVKADERQLIWIVIEDDNRLNAKLANTLRNLGLPFVYFAHGPTRFYGNAQWNAAERAVHVLRDSFFSDGPVLNVDDDSRILPELLKRIWKVKKAVLWQVGNLGGNKLLWEGPVFKEGRIVDWVVGGLFERKFPIDMGGFAYNSSLIGDGRPISPPQYVPANDFGGESEFLEQILKGKEEIEPLCDNTIEEHCRFAWHNWIDGKPRQNSPP